jgi:hypothetical protein
MPRVRRTAPLLAVIVAAVACSGGTTTPSPTAVSAAASPTASPPPPASPTPVAGSDPTARGVTRATLATQGFAFRQHLQPYLGVWEARSLAPGGTFAHPQIMPALGYVAEGTVRWTTASGSIDIKAGEAAGTPHVLPITETNPGTTAAIWYAFGVAEFGLEAETPAPMRRLATGSRLPVPQPDGSYTLRLDSITLDGSGRTASQSHAGAELILVLDGQVEIRTMNGSHDFRGPKEGLGIAPGGAVQVLNRTLTPARILEFFYTPDALTFETTLATAP